MNESTIRAGSRFAAIARMAATLCFALFAAACQGGDEQPTRLAPSGTSALMACMLAAQSTVGATSTLLESCAKEMPKIMSKGLDQVAIDGVLAGTAGNADPGITGGCFIGDKTRGLAAVETMGYGVVVDGASERVHIVQQDDVTTYHRDGTSESRHMAAAPVATMDTAAGPSACTMMLVHALTVASLCSDQQWTGRGCVKLHAQMQYCGDPTRLMVDPDLGFVCQPAVNGSAVTTAAAKACAGRGSGATCAPEASTSGWLRDPGGICASPGATVSSDRETCVVPVSVKGPQGSADITAVILWGKTTSGGPIFTAEPAKPRG